ncbi:hypothetical protein BT96DRAFT_915730 [Gymnopus androsaceus JB14]|uniref:Uncharacterized protein n=1 Tax=Gymnopus androsaceus JB14 TaxID=1447944 RepID=A0A6A4I638_9AGAR|nr:hypothetical protein BT96DRAFT_915730 [Gymnopus androsaceus JB14]
MHTIFDNVSKNLLSMSSTSRTTQKVLAIAASASDAFDVPHTLSPKKSLQHLLHPPVSSEENVVVQEIGKKPLSFLNRYKDVWVSDNVKALQSNLQPMSYNKNKMKQGKTSLYGKSKLSSIVEPQYKGTALASSNVISTSSILSSTPCGSTIADGDPIHHLAPEVSIKLPALLVSSADTLSEANGLADRSPAEHTPLEAVSPTAPTRDNDPTPADHSPSSVSVELAALTSLVANVDTKHTSSRAITPTDHHSPEPEPSITQSRRARTSSIDSDRDFWSYSPSSSFQSYRNRSSSIIESYEPAPARFYAESPFGNHPDTITSFDIPPSPLTRTSPSPSCQPSLSRDVVSEDLSHSTDTFAIEARRQYEGRTINKVLPYTGRLRLVSLPPLDDALETPTRLYLENQKAESEVSRSVLFDGSKGGEELYGDSKLVASEHSLYLEIDNNVEQASSAAGLTGSGPSMTSAIALGVDSEKDYDEKAGSLFSGSENSDEEDYLFTFTRSSYSQPTPTPKPSSRISSRPAQCPSPPPSPKAPLPSPLPLLKVPAAPPLSPPFKHSSALVTKGTLPSRSIGSSRLARNFIQTSHKQKICKRRRKTEASLILGLKPRDYASSSVRYMPYRGRAPVKTEREVKPGIKHQVLEDEVKKEKAVKVERKPTVNEPSVVKEEEPVKEEKSTKKRKAKPTPSERVEASSPPQKRFKPNQQRVDRVMVAKWVGETFRLFYLGHKPTVDRVHGELLLEYLTDIEKRKDEITTEFLRYPPGKDNLAILNAKGFNLGLMEKAVALRTYFAKREGITPPKKRSLNQRSIS